MTETRDFARQKPTVANAADFFITLAMCSGVSGMVMWKVGI